MDANERRRLWSGRVLRSAEEVRRADAEFLRRMTPDERIAILSDMSLEAQTLRTGHTDQPRFDRTAGRVVRP